MDNLYANVIKTFHTIRDYKPDDDPTLAADVLLDSPAENIGDIRLRQYDADFAGSPNAAVTNAAAGTDDEYSDDDFIDPNVSKEVRLSEDILSEIELKFEDIEKKISIILTSMDLRLYADDRPALKRSIYNDMYAQYLSKYEYITDDIKLRLAATISKATDKAFSALSSDPNKRIADLFARLLAQMQTFIDDAVSTAKQTGINDTDKFADRLYRTAVTGYIRQTRQTHHYSGHEYAVICRMTKAYIKKQLSSEN